MSDEIYIVPGTYPEDDSDSEEEEEDDTEDEFFDGDIKDGFLCELVDLCNAGGAMPITLHLGAMFISGTMIGVEAYFEELRAWAKSKITDAHSSTEFDSFLAGWQQGSKAAVRDEDPCYIHVKDARYFGANGAIIKGQASLWRGRVVTVAGFSFGALSELDPWPKSMF